jgi:hypothetical protein
MPFACTLTDPQCRSQTKLFHVEFSDLQTPEEDSVKPWCDQLESQLFEAEYLADEDSIFVPADIVAIVHSSQKEALRYVNSGNLRGRRTELGGRESLGLGCSDPHVGVRC